jgi:hypothetical protein
MVIPEKPKLHWYNKYFLERSIMFLPFFSDLLDHWRSISFARGFPFQSARGFILRTGIIFNFLMLPPPAGEGWGGGSEVKIMTVGSIPRGMGNLAGVPISRIIAGISHCTIYGDASPPVFSSLTSGR